MSVCDVEVSEAIIKMNISRNEVIFFLTECLSAHLPITFSKQEPCPRPECYKCTNVRRDIKMKDDGHGFCLVLGEGGGTQIRLVDASALPIIFSVLSQKCQEIFCLAP